MNDTTIALAIVLAVLVVAAVSSRWVAVAASLLAFACYNFFVLPPVGTFAIDEGDDIVALVALLAVSLIGSHLSQQARRRADEALLLGRQRNEAEMARKGAEAKAALVASLGHDLKTPLTALTVAAGNLGLGELSSEERREQLQIVREELSRLQRLFDDVVEMASVETRSLNAELEWVHPVDIVDAARGQAASSIGERRLDVHDHTDGLFQLDPRLTSAAMAHVLENAAAYSAPSSPIDVEARAESGRLVLSVRDHGPGLPPGGLDRVFERFYRGTDAGNRFGTGMGLAISRGLVALQGGRISAANHAEGGAVFTIAIPAAMRPTSELALDL